MLKTVPFLETLRSIPQNQKMNQAMMMMIKTVKTRIFQKMDKHLRSLTTLIVAVIAVLAVQQIQTRILVATKTLTMIILQALILLIMATPMKIQTTIPLILLSGNISILDAIHMVLTGPTTTSPSQIKSQLS